ncbi:hypothetical protein DU002_16240 [Corallincola holothuriorum]|uniref:Porin n=1 Tax=Corallincola holothuriorum TaxID=2282215 RepID=A0A368N3X1_9GAMM|nr:porin [Corallincola holothuriorum]RCU45267.1 hypothetical protein DU002_16240 [Corallincola holothuriorum]
MRTHKLTTVAAATLLAISLAPVANAGAKLEITEDSFINLGAGIRTTASGTEDGSPNGDSWSTDFNVDNIRLYLSGQLMPAVKFTFNTEKIDGDIDVLDAIVQYEPSKEFNIWAGKMLTPADRIEMSGPFYALTWNQYTVPLYPSDQGGEAGRIGRDDGVTVWGAFDKFQYAVGVFDGLEGYSNQDDNLLFATRLSYSFWNMEGNPAYYTSSTYYGAAGDVLTLGVSAQYQEDGTGTTTDAEDFTGYAVDVLMEKVLDGGGVVTLEGEYKMFDADLSAAARASADCFCLFDGDAYFATAAYLFADPVGIGKVQPYVRYTSNSPDDYDDSDLTEVGVNYIIKGHNLRLNANYTTGDANASGYAAADDADSFSLGVQFQI